MQKNALTADVIDRVNIHATTITYKHAYWGDYQPTGVIAAQMNVPYVVAVTALEGELSVDQFTEEKINDPKIIEFSRKVEVTPDPNLDELGTPFRHAVIAEVKTKDGKTFTERVDNEKGSDKRPITNDEVRRKYRMLGGKVVDQKHVEELEGLIDRLDEVSDVRNLARLLVT
jgi:2-methylcitrate dehydratase PrpD